MLCTLFSSVIRSTQFFAVLQYSNCFALLFATNISSDLSLCTQMSYMHRNSNTKPLARNWTMPSMTWPLCKYNKDQCGACPLSPYIRYSLLAMYTQLYCTSSFCISLGKKWNSTCFVIYLSSVLCALWNCREIFSWSTRHLILMLSLLCSTFLKHKLLLLFLRVFTMYLSTATYCVKITVTVSPWLKCWCCC